MAATRHNKWFREMTIEEQIGHYWAMVRFWTSVVWHYPNDVNKQVLAQNIGKLEEFNRRRSRQ